jgi:hypothetical protein
VLVSLSSDGQLAGYQAGNRIWTQRIGPSSLRRVDDLAALKRGSDWFVVAPETGQLQPLAAACPAGPLGEVGGQPITVCPGAPPGVPFELHPVRQDVSVVAWPDGTWQRFDAGAPASPLMHGAGGGRPGLSPDGGKLVWPHDYPGSSAVAFSRDGTFVYAIGGGRLRVFPTGGKGPVLDVAADGSDIALVAGG